MFEPLLLRSHRVPPQRSGVLVSLTRERAGWEFLRVGVRRVARGDTWTSRTGRDELCLVLLGGACRVRWTPGGRGEERLGPRKSVFDAYPHAVYLPGGTRFTIEAD